MGFILVIWTIIQGDRSSFSSRSRVYSEIKADGTSSHTPFTSVIHSTSNKPSRHRAGTRIDLLNKIPVDISIASLSGRGKDATPQLLTNLATRTDFLVAVSPL